jgi:hypothetical protein
MIDDPASLYTRAYYADAYDTMLEAARLARDFRHAWLAGVGGPGRNLLGPVRTVARVAKMHMLGEMKRMRF